MENSLFDQLEQIDPRGDSATFWEQLKTGIEQSGDYHKLFDMMMLQKKYELGIPLSRPSSLQDVPQEYRAQVEELYVSAAREIGQKFLEKDDLPSAWMYLQVIREPEKIAAKIDEFPDKIDDYEQMEELIRIALYEGVNPPKAVKIMLHGHGTCSTITALEQALPQMSQEHRQSCAKLMVQNLYQDLRDSVRRHVEQKVPMLTPDESLASLLTGRDWIFDGGNYHIDVSHLNSVVRFARSIEAPAEEIDLALQLASYGAKLDASLQYDGDPPFEDFYPAHIHFFNVLINRHRDDGLQYFREKLEAEPDDQDKPLLAYVLVDLLVRCEQLDEAVDLSAQYLAGLNEDVSISFDELCVKAERFDVLKETRRAQGDLVGFAAARLREDPSSSAAES